MDKEDEGFNHLRAFVLHMYYRVIMYLVTLCQDVQAECYSDNINVQG